jgi:predicted metallopeptidase
MKRLFCIFILVAGAAWLSAAFGQCQQTLDDVYATVAADLGLDTLPVRTIKVVQASFKTTGIKPTDEPAAATQRLRNNDYLIALYCEMDTDRLVRVLLHEFVHILQMQTGRLQVFKHYIAFDGQLYTRTTEWQDRPFEMEAIAMADRLYEKYFAPKAAR